MILKTSQKASSYHGDELPRGKPRGIKNETTILYQLEASFEVWTRGAITPEEKDMPRRIANNQYTGGAYKRATFIDKVCRNKADKAVLDTFCRKGLAETGLGGTVAGDTYRACWLTQKGKAAEKGLLTDG